jgi:hypothetical protein
MLLSVDPNRVLHEPLRAQSTTHSLVDLRRWIPRSIRSLCDIPG